MDLKAWKFKQRTGGYRKKVRRVYQNMQKFKKATLCENSVIEILNNTFSFFTQLRESNLTFIYKTYAFNLCFKGCIGKRKKQKLCAKSEYNKYKRGFRRSFFVNY